jgi:hypothetical protein
MQKLRSGTRISWARISATEMSSGFGGKPQVAGGVCWDVEDAGVGDGLAGGIWVVVTLLVDGWTENAVG